MPVDDPVTAIAKAIWDDYLFAAGSSLLTEIEAASRFSWLDRSRGPREEHQPSDLPAIEMSLGDFNWAPNAGGAAQTYFNQTYVLVVNTELLEIDQYAALKHKVFAELTKGKTNFGVNESEYWVINWTATGSDELDEQGRILTIRIAVEYHVTDSYLTS